MLFVMVFLYGLFGISCMIFEINNINKNKNINIITLVRLMYIVVNSILPIIILILIDNGNTTLEFNLNKNTVGTIDTLTVFFFTVFGYLSLNLGYYGSFQSIGYNSHNFQKRLYLYNGKLIVVGGILLALAWFCLFKWTSSYGSIQEFIRNAARIRSGYGNENSFAFLKHFVKLFNLLTPVFCLQWLKNRKRSLSNATIYLVLFSLSLLGSIIYVLCSDSRAGFAILLIVTFLSAVEFNSIDKQDESEKAIRRMVIVFIIAFVLISILPQLLDKFRFGRNITVSSNSINITRFLVDEFGFVFKSQITSVKTFFSDRFSLQLWNDISNSLVAYIPTRFRPYTPPINLWDYNTLIMDYSPTGQIPSDLVASSIHLLGVAGILIIPFIFGFFVKKIERWVECFNDDAVRIAVKYSFGLMMLWCVAYYQLYSIVYSYFYLYFGMVIIYFCAHKKEYIEVE